MVTRVADSGARPSPTLTSGSAEALVTAGQQLPAPERVHFTLGRSRCPQGWTCTCCSMSALSRPGPACRPLTQCLLAGRGLALLLGPHGGGLFGFSCPF